MRSQLKIQLGDGDILALLGGEGDASIEIRNHIVQEFTKRHLKALVNEEWTQRAATAVIGGVRQEIAEQIGKTDWSGVVTLSPTLKNRIEHEVSVILHSELTAAVNRAWKAVIERDLDALLQKRLEAITETYINTAAEKKLKALMSKIQIEY